MQSQTESLTTYSYTDSELNTASTDTLTLDVCFAADKISYTLHSGHKIWGFRYLQTTTPVFELHASVLQQLLNKLEWLTLSTKQTRVFIETSMFTLVPSVLFEATKAETYLQLTHKLTAAHHVSTYELATQKAVVVYGMPQSFNQFLLHTFANAPVVPYLQNLIQVAQSFPADELKQSLVVYFGKEYCTILSYVKNEIAFLNTYPVASDTDAVYFILSVAELLQLQANKFGIYTLGDLSVTSSLFALLKKYIPHVLTAGRLDGISYPLAFREFQDQQHYLPLHTLLCE